MKTIISIILFGLMMVGCASKPAPKKVEIVKKIENIEENPRIYRGNFKIKYSAKRVVYADPYLMPDGTLISERTIEILPNHPSWTNVKAGFKNKKLKKYFKDKEEEIKKGEK